MKSDAYEAIIDLAREEKYRLQKYEQLVRFIAADYHELSYEKAMWQRDDWKKRCIELIKQDAEKLLDSK